ncbi:uncharacterized protein LOC122506058 [Leptopilina heterotoma]|uniref:uncharacterized protein LOC122506058 n=1 Tax=Leptopilina heterotoma TaxID=63436 RepID=UPI001CA8B1B6|nr:uncharacterized protein LOC122506058 [Leptopilina heterotoma]
MKCILLCCVLAFCALQTSSADRLMDQLWKLQFRAMEEINAITNPIMSQIRGDVETAKSSGKNAEPCYERGRLLMKSYVDPSFSGLRKCRTDAHAANSVSLAISCNNNIVSLFRSNAQTVRPVSTSCIASL